ncbi:beta-1,4-galactosyltransferase galt-1-like [Gigantopelta aegis]|uniref:beta-1,4-galactosyltransferase galt-1-like n=1 Tax=Gigantopelta aegis TaxID=1735272 RepID=UPI001B88C5A7|nr:beta-1,4-galactosyltransferase galt-1-like [Gigantopelta aegis]
MTKRSFFRSVSFNRFVLLLCGLYISMVFVFHNQLYRGTTANVEERRPTSENLVRKDVILNTSVEGLKDWVKHYNNVKDLARKISKLETEVAHIRGELIIQQPIQHAGKKKVDQGKPLPKVVLNSTIGYCFKEPTDVKDNKFQEISPDVFVYSAYFDNRKSEHFIRLIVLMPKDKIKKISLFCHFRSGTQTYAVEKAIPYEMCENHNKQYGGHIFSCKTSNVQDLCPFSVSTDSSEPGTRISIIKGPQSPPRHQFGICIPPLFGNLKQEILIEFVELSRILGAEYFYFYNHNISPDMKMVLDYYQTKNLTTVIPWMLPDRVADKLIWYHGQLLAHNDCLYRSITMLSFLAIHDVDEFIVPHTSAKTWQEFLPPLLGNHCGFTFKSSFFDPSLSTPYVSPLLTMAKTVRSPMSNVRKKVMVSPRRVFEVGIHHISKQNEEQWTPLEIKSDLAFLHHYRKCIGNYGMKCQKTVVDETVPFKYGAVLEKSFNLAIKELKQFEQQTRSLS